MPTPNPVLSVRMSRSERDLLAIAAGQAHTSVSEFVRRKALEAAEIDVLDHRLVAIPAAYWEQFEQWVNAPAQAKDALRDLAATRPSWQD